jgi:pyruvate formate lyase activating enzyme
LTGYASLKETRKKCVICGETRTISRALQICLNCIRDRPRDSLSLIKEAHENVRAPYDLPPEPPSSLRGVECNLCSNNCNIGEGERGYCGLRSNYGGLNSLSAPDQGLLYYYIDPHVTNCCGAWFCPGGTGAGYPIYAKRQAPEYGFHNLSIFFYGCNFNCLFCQNSSHKQIDGGRKVNAKELISRVQLDDKITCICYFGGSPEPQLPFSINVSKTIGKATEDRVLRFCWEWNGCGDPRLVREAAQIALASGGNIKFDLKCHDPSLSLALSGVNNSRSFSNFEMIGHEFYHKRSEVPVLTATTLLVPGYVDDLEVGKIARFVADIDSGIPYSLLLFHPSYAMSDLPVTSFIQAKECYNAAIESLDNVKIGNLHMLGLRSMKEFLEKI